MHRLVRPVFVLLSLCTLLGSPARAEPESAPNQGARPRLDVAFILDTTGSMGDEIDVVKEKLVSIAKKLASGQPKPDVRFAVVAYRDKGDEYVTKTFDFERDIKKVRKHIMGLSADGGGDEPEDIASALQAASKLKWDSSPDVTRVAFLVGDAGPHAYPGEPTWQHGVANFRERKIEVETIGCSGLSRSALAVFKDIAERTGGHFEQLTYSRVVASADGHKRTVLSRGGETYVAEGELSEKDWKEGADKLVATGRAKKAASLPMDAAGGAAAAPMMNNLDAEISRSLMEKAASAGTRYVK